MDLESSVSNMPYSVHRHNSERIEGSTFLNAQGNSIRDFEGQNNRPSPPDYNEVNGDVDHGKCKVF